MQFSNEQLKMAAVNGEKKAAEALSVLAKNPVNVKTSDVKDIIITDPDLVFDKIDGHAVIAYTQAVSGVFGLSLLSMERNDGLHLVDLFNNRTQGTTVVMQEIDRSTIRETLNILANAYATELAKLVDTPIILDVPHMITNTQIANVVNIVDSKEKKAVLFQAKLAVENVDFGINLYFFFLTGEKK